MNALARQAARDVVGLLLGAAVAWYLTDTRWRARLAEAASEQLRWPG